MQEQYEQKRLYRSRTNRVFAGICGGLGEYGNFDPVLIRLFWIIVTIFTGLIPGILTYILAIFVVPERPQESAQASSANDTQQESNEEKAEEHTET